MNRKSPDNFKMPPRNLRSTSASSASVKQSQVSPPTRPQDMQAGNSVGIDLQELNWQPVVRIDVNSCKTPPALNMQRMNDRQQTSALNNNALLSMPVNHPDERHASVSDESIPPTMLTPNLLGLRPTTSSSFVDPNNSNLNMPIPPIRGVVKANIRSRKQPPVRQKVPRNSSVPVCTSPVSASNPVRTAPVSGRNPVRTAPVSGRNPVRTAPVSGCNTGRTSPLPVGSSGVSTHIPRRTRSFRQIITPHYLRDCTTLSETSSMSNFDPFANNDDKDPDYEPSEVSSISSDYSIEKKPKVENKKVISKVKPVVSNNARKRKIDQVPQNETRVIAGNNDFDDFSSTISGPFKDFVCPYINMDDDDDDAMAHGDTMHDSIYTIDPSLSTAQWVDSQIQSCTEVTVAATTSTTTSGDLQTVEGSALTAPRNVVSTAPAISKLTASESCSTVISEANKSKAAKKKNIYCKLPRLPVFRTKKNTLIKNCSTRLVNDFQELLTIQHDTTFPLCKACKRCELLTKYNKIVVLLPVSDGKEPDILKRKPRDVYEFDSDEEGLKFLRRGRDLVGEVLTTKSFPIWLSNLEMVLKKTMFIDEHERGTLKKNVIFDNNDVLDAVVCNLIIRIEYLDSCIKEDTKELKAKQFRRKLRSTTRSGAQINKNLSPKRRGMRRGPRPEPTLLSPPPVSSPGPPPVSLLPNILTLGQPEDTDVSHLSPHTEEPSNNGLEPSMEGHCAPVPNLLPLGKPEETDDCHLSPHTEEPSNNGLEPSMKGHCAPVPNLLPLGKPEETDDCYLSPHTEEPSNNGLEPSMEGHCAPVPNLLPLGKPEETDDCHLSPHTEEPSNIDLEPSMEGHSAEDTDNSHLSPHTKEPSNIDLEPSMERHSAEDTDNSHLSPHTEEPSNIDLEPSMEGYSSEDTDNIQLSPHTEEPSNIDLEPSMEGYSAEDTDSSHLSPHTEEPSNIDLEPSMEGYSAEDTDNSHLSPHTEEPSNIDLEPSMEGHYAPVPNLFPFGQPDDTDDSHLWPHTVEPSNNGLEPSMEGHCAPVPNLLPRGQPEDTHDSHLSPHTVEPSNIDLEPSMEGHYAPVPNLFSFDQPEDTHDSHLSPHTVEPSNNGLGPTVRDPSTSRLTGLWNSNQIAELMRPLKEGVYRPTLEQFQDPMAYIESIQGEASKYGIIKIIPPKNYEVPFRNLETDILFSTKKQYPSRLYQRWGASSRQMTLIQTCVSLADGVSGKDTESYEIPLVEGMEVDLAKLYELVMENGGIEQFRNQPDKWFNVAVRMGLTFFSYETVIARLQSIYDRHVLPYAGLSYYDRNKFVERVDQIWNSRSNKAIRRASRPLHHQKRMLGETHSDDDDDDEHPPDPRMEEVRVFGKSVFERTEMCIENGPHMNLSTFLLIEQQLLKIYLANQPQACPYECQQSYWFILLASLGSFHVSVYTATIDTSLHDAGHVSDPAAPGGSHPWNLKRLGENPRNVLSSLGKTPHVTVPVITLSQTSSCNCWQTDPHRLILVDCMLQGASKMWYGVTERDGSQFRNTVSHLTPRNVKNKHHWLQKDSTMILPGTLLDNLVNVRSIEQGIGEIMVVFPGAYYSNVSNGFSVTESIYVQTSQWLYDADVIFQRMRNDCEPTMFSNVDLLLRLATNPNVSVEMLPQIQLSIKSLIEVELEARREAIKLGCRIHIHETDEQNDVDHCSICHTSLILSKVSQGNFQQTAHYLDHSIPMCLLHGLRVYGIAPIEGRVESAPPVVLFYTDAKLHNINWALKKRIIDSMRPHTIDAPGILTPPA